VVAAPLLRSWLPAILLLAAAFLAGPARAAVDLRVEAASSISDPIEAFVTVTDANGAPVGGLHVSDFALLLDGATVQSPGFTLPPAQDVTQKVSVIFVMDYSGSVQNTALDAMQTAVIDFIKAMRVGDFAAIVKFNGTNPDKASVVKDFTEIDGPAGTGTSALTSAVMAPYPGKDTNLLDAVDLAVNQFATPSVPLPSGPKIVILISDGAENASKIGEGRVVQDALDNSVPIFTIGVGSIRPGLLTRLAVETGGAYLPAPSDSEITAAYANILDRLKNEYLLSISSTIADCDNHTLQVSVTGQAAPASVTFARCSPSSFAVPNVTGQTQAAATIAITDAGLVVRDGGVTEQSSSTVAPGTVISQNPPAGTNVAHGSPVDLVVSSGVAVPDVAGQTQAAATSAITAASLMVGTVTQQSSSTVASGSVISQSPAAGKNVAGGSAVNLVVSSGAGSGGGGGGGSGGGGGGGGGGAVGVATLFASLLALAVRRRRFR
jgi:VWFA-related protein